MENARKPITSAAIIGSGAVALCSALALKRALPKADIRVMQGATTGGGIADSILLVHPPAMRLLDLIGLDETGPIRSGLASHTLGDRFTGWTKAPFIVPVAEEEPVAMGIPISLIERMRTGRRDPATGSAAIALAEAGKFDPDSLHRTDAGDAIGYALHLDTAGFTALLRRFAEQAGVIFIGDTDSLAEVDLRLECAGCGAVLQDARSEDWGEAIPDGEMLLWDAVGPPSLLNEYAARDWGWLSTLPGPRTTRQVAVFDPKRGAPSTPPDARKLAFATGRLERPMEGRRVALGDAAAVPGPLGGFGFTLAAMHLALLLDLMPGSEPHPLIEREYNRRAALISDEIRDFVSALHVHSQHAGALWKRLRKHGGSVELMQVTRRFARSGRLPPREVDAIGDASWTRALDALVEAGSGYDALALSVPLQRADEVLDAQRNAVAKVVRSQTDYDNWLTEERGQ
ncbi:tryptophan 7-halogenase [Erythrobacter sp. LQ02-29]|uniref:tryptophan 7-halogenase n=1 Tax=Erythrobacter sp. LQ02-29 TaxID=2920384 RepID=UPI001F4DD010|nr:tryptophan 7-halogenase [Erythrobacter sp. LQ02-29]MCP9222621.1 tryptophan 7-halogenase [Erythrobacter sp. LQ02-29]